ncbi:MAX gene-associated protein isoform 2-T4 [Anomaloglossus baeobatrachus]|uniref:MAX gene-associated protein isoform X2 n=1 Tax=Anomaloglossus baeobatrachus TaxID=238106 RepID=UPI003F503BEE
MEEESTEKGGTEGGSKPMSKAPAFFVLLHPSHGDGSKEEGILVANTDVSSVAPVITTGPNKSKSDFFLSANCISGEITVTLDNNNMWNEFYRCTTEMVLTKQGRRMFPYCRYWISGLNPYLKYILVMDISPLDNYRHKWNGKWWEPGGKADPHVLGRVFIHPESPSTGQYWMHQPVSFYKLKLTNNILDQDGHIILHSMHRYLPRLHVVPAEKASEVIQLNGPDVHTFTFPQTEFIAVTAYQNFQITQLKIDCNPFAKGFREGMVPGRPPGNDVKNKPEPEVDSSSSKNAVENEESSNMEKLQELFRMSEYLDGDKENERFSSVQDLLRFTKSKSELAKNSKQSEDVIKRYDEPSSLTAPSKPTKQPSVVIKKEPEDHYDYSQPPPIGSVTVKQEPSDAEITDDYSNSDDDYPILEKHFAKFKEDFYLDDKHLLNSPIGVAIDKLVKAEPDCLPVLHLEPSAADKNRLEAPDTLKLSEEALQDTDEHKSAICKASPVFPSITIKSEVVEDVPVKEKRKRICKKKIDEIYATLQTALKTSRGPKRKFPVLFTKPSVTPTPGNEGTGAPIAKKRGRPPKAKFAKEALDVHTVKQPVDTVSSGLSPLEAPTEQTDDVKKILDLEQQLMTHLKTMKYRQVIHPALQQVGLKLNIVDPAMSIDLRYLGVELPLPHITSDTKYDDNGLCAQGLQFVSRTGKTTDYTKIKGWRDKFSAESSTASLKNEAGRPESSLKNMSAFCSDELDEYLENEAKLMGDLKELTPEPESSISYQLPTKSSSYVRTLDSVLKKQAQQAMSSLNAAEQFPAPRVKRKYTRRAPVVKSNPKPTPLLPVSTTAKKPVKSHSAAKKSRSTSHPQNLVISPPSSPVELLSKPKPVVKASEEEQMDTVRQNLYQAHMQSQQFFSKPIGFSKSQLKLSDFEESATLEGKPRTYVTEERASVSLCTLLTAQASLKKKPILTFNKKPRTSCKKEFCRLGCICSSLSFTKLTATHCRHEECMFSCECLKSKSDTGKDGLMAKGSRNSQEKAEIDVSPNPGYGYKPEHGGKSLDAMQREQLQELSVDGLQNRPIKAKKRKSIESHDTISDMRAPIRFPIWDRSDVADDPEPLSIPEQGEVVETSILHKVHIEKNKSLEGRKPCRPSSVTKVPPKTQVHLYSNNMKTCARVRGYQRKSPEEKNAKYLGKGYPDARDKGHVHTTVKAIKQEKKDDVYEIMATECKAFAHNGPTKPIEMISDSRQEEDECKVLNITPPQITSKVPPPFTFGSCSIELSQEQKGEETSTFSSQEMIETSAEKLSDPDPSEPSTEKRNVESVDPPDEDPEDTSADKEEKSPAVKGLPFFSKIIPGGKLMARLKSSDINKAELVEVNGKKYPQAKLLLGQMGALHPANRLAAYLTQRLDPKHFHISKANEALTKMATSSPASDSTTKEKSKSILLAPQSKTAAQSRPSSLFTQFVSGEVGSILKSPGVSSSDPTIPGSPKLGTQSTRLLVISSAVAATKQTPAITTTSSMNMPSLSTTSHSSAGLNTASPSKTNATSLLPTVVRITRVVTKGSSVFTPTGKVAEKDGASVPSTKSNTLTLPLLTPALTKPLETSSVPFSKKPCILKKIAPSNLLLAPNTAQLAPVASPFGINIGSPMAVQPVTTSTLSSGVSSGVQKSLGPRLLLIPVNSTSSPTRPVQCIQSPPGQKMILQPIKSSNGVTLFKHPNGQIIQLVPLQKVNSANVQQSKQHVVFRNPGGVLSVRLPLLTKPEAAATTTTVSTTSSPTTVPVVSPSKISPNKSGVTILSQNLPVLSQLGTTAGNNTSPSKSNCEASVNFPQILSYSGNGHTVITSNIAPYQSGLSLANILPPPPPPLLQNCSPVSAAAKPTITPTGNPSESACDPDKQDKKRSDLSLSPQLSGEPNDKESVKESEGQPTSEIVNNENEAEAQSSPKEEIKSVTQAKAEQCHDGQQVNEQSQASTDSTDECLTSDEDLFKETKKAAQGPADEDDNRQSPAEKNTSSQVEIGNKSPVTSVSVSDPEQVEQNMQYKSGEKAEFSMNQSSTKSQVSASSSHKQNSDSRRRDPHIKQDIIGSRNTRPSLQIEVESDAEDSLDIEIVEELSEKTSASPVTFKKKKHGLKRKYTKKHKKKSKSEVDEYSDVEIVEKPCETIDLTDPEPSASTVASQEDQCGSEGNRSKGRKQSSKGDVEDVIITIEDDDDDDSCNTFHHRKNHTVNERKRRSELRDLFDEMKNALRLHNVTKVSKSYLLKQAIEQIEDLTDTADTLTKKKTLLSQTQTQLIKKVSNLSDMSAKRKRYSVEYKKGIVEDSRGKNLTDFCKGKMLSSRLIRKWRAAYGNLSQQVDSGNAKKLKCGSGKSKEVVLKKVEYKCAKEKAMAAETQIINLEEDDDLHKESINLPLPKREPFVPLKLEESYETLRSKTKKPIILGRKSVLLSTDGKQQPGVSLPTSHVLMAPTGHMEHNIPAEQAVESPLTLIKADLSPAQIKSGMTSVVIQLPSTVQLKDIVGHSPVPVSLSAEPGDLSAFTPAFSENDDLSMMPKIVNVTSLAPGNLSDLAMELDIGTPDSERVCKSDVHSLRAEKGNASVWDASFEPGESCMPSTSFHMDKVEESLTNTTGKSPNRCSNLHDNPPQENDSSNTGASLQCEIVSSSNDALRKTDDLRDSGLNLEINKSTSAIDEAGLVPSALFDTMGDAEEADENLTSLLDEIAFLNQQINTDTDDLDSVSDFPGLDAASHSSTSKLADGDSSPFSLDRCREVKEKHMAFNSFFMQLEEGEIPDSTKHHQETVTVAFEGGASREPPLTEVGAQSGLHQTPASNASTCEKTEKTVTSDVFWRPMPKLTPFGLKSHTLPSDQRSLASKSMPSLASVTVRLSSPKTTD